MVGFTTAWDILALGLLIGSVFLAQHDMEPTMDQASGKVPVSAGKVLLLVTISLEHLWSVIEHTVLRHKPWKEMEVKRKVFIGSIRAIFILSMAGCWPTLLEDDYDGFLAVSTP